MVLNRISHLTGASRISHLTQHISPKRSIDSSKVGECEMWDARCEMWDAPVRCEMRQAARCASHHNDFLSGALNVCQNIVCKPKPHLTQKLKWTYFPDLLLRSQLPRLDYPDSITRTLLPALYYLDLIIQYPGRPASITWTRKSGIRPKLNQLFWLWMLY